jgi:hypothetical protein
MLENDRNYLNSKQLNLINDGIHYNGNDIYTKKTEWIACVGQRTNGKSFWWLAIATMEFFEFGYNIGYVRRQKEEIINSCVEEYFSDVNYIKFVKENYGFDGVICKEKKLYFVAYDENGKIIKEQTTLFGKAFALSTARNNKSLHYDLINNIIFEEFITDGSYLTSPPEWKRWNNLISTIYRDRKGRVILIGNTIERNCPYFREMGINILKLKQGTVTKYKADDVDFIVEYTGLTTQTNKMFIGQSAKQINKGEWDSDKYPHLFCDLDDVEKLFKFYYCYNEFCFKCECFIFNDKKYIFVRPYNKEDLESNYYDDIFEKGFHLENNYFNYPKKKRHRKIWDMFLDNRVVYSDNLCGTEFNNCLKNFNPFFTSRRI